ncbi:alpha/beta hydrolase [Aestuariivirga sp.]|uniref:alpha/beta hydrolase n=1 Tax=Aestuariivirga sp. TaxID=2650926 RepID=UPI0039E3F1A7
MTLFTALRTAVVAAIAAYAVLVIAVYLMQGKLLFRADATRVPPAALGLANAAEETIATPDGEKLVAWYAPAANGMPTILFLHGNAGNLSGRAERFAYYTKQGFGALFIDYRGYGGSTGTPSGTGLVTDAEAAYDWLAAKGIPPSNIAVVGESLGTGISVLLAAQRPAAAVALEAPYTSMADVAASHYWWLPARLLIRNPIAAGDEIGKMHAPLLIQHGDKDVTVPYALGQKLFAMANEPKQFVTIPGAGHIIFNDETFGRETDFFRKVFALPQ